MVESEKRRGNQEALLCSCSGAREGFSCRVHAFPCKTDHKGQLAFSASDESCETTCIPFKTHAFQEKDTNKDRPGGSISEGG